MESETAQNLHSRYSERLSDSVKDGQYLDQLNNCQLLKDMNL